jgi:predicted RNase H-like HicB family nuclease
VIIKLELPIELTKEDSLFIAICPVFCVGSQGKTEEEALSNAKEAQSLFRR